MLICCEAVLLFLHALLFRHTCPGDNTGEEEHGIYSALSMQSWCFFLPAGHHRPCRALASAAMVRRCTAQLPEIAC